MPSPISGRPGSEHLTVAHMSDGPPHRQRTLIQHRLSCVGEVSGQTRSVPACVGNPPTTFAARWQSPRKMSTTSVPPRQNISEQPAAHKQTDATRGGIPHKAVHPKWPSGVCLPTRFRVSLFALHGSRNTCPSSPVAKTSKRGQNMQLTVENMGPTNSRRGLPRLVQSRAGAWQSASGTTALRT